MPLDRSFVFVDAEVRARMIGFPIPPIALRKAVRAGQTVKIIFQPRSQPQGSDAAERMWLYVVRAERGGPFVGRLVNHPTVVDAKFGEEFVFGVEHVIDIDGVAW